MLETKKMEGLVRAFMGAFEQRCYTKIDDVPPEIAMLRSALIKEEAAEYNIAGHRHSELDAIVDLLYVTIGTNLALGIEVLPYSSGQLRISNLAKPRIFSEVSQVTQDLDSRFPCAKVQYRVLNALTQRLLDIATQLGYRLFPAFEAVHAANMGKLWPAAYCHAVTLKNCTMKEKPEGWLVLNEKGKVIKPPTFTAPDLTAFI